MKNLIKTFLFLFLASFCMFSCADDDAPQKGNGGEEQPEQREIMQLVIWSKDGSKVAYALEDKPVLTFADGYLHIKTRKAKVSYAIDKLLRFTHEKTSVRSLAHLKTNKSFELTNEGLIFPALPVNSKVSVLAKGGKVVLEKTVGTSGEYALPFSDLPSGEYVVRVNGQCYKLTC